MVRNHRREQINEENIYVKKLAEIKSRISILDQVAEQKTDFLGRPPRDNQRNSGWRESRW